MIVVRLACQLCGYWWSSFCAAHTLLFYWCLMISNAHFWETFFTCLLPTIILCCIGCALKQCCSCNSNNIVRRVIYTGVFIPLVGLVTYLGYLRIYPNSAFSQVSVDFWWRWDRVIKRGKKRCGFDIYNKSASFSCSVSTIEVQANPVFLFSISST